MNLEGKTSFKKPEKRATEKEWPMAMHAKYLYIEHHSVCPLVGIGTPPPL